MSEATLSAIISACSGLAGTIIGGFVTYFTTSAQKNKDQVIEIRAISKGIGAEMRAYVDLVTKRNHTDAVLKVVALLKAGQDVALSSLASNSGTIKDFFPVFFANIEKIGSLDGEIEEIAKFHTQLAGVYATLTRVAAGIFDKVPPATKIELLETEIALWEDTLSLGRAVSTRLLNK